MVLSSYLNWNPKRNCGLNRPPSLDQIFSIIQEDHQNGNVTVRTYSSDQRQFLGMVWLKLRMASQLKERSIQEWYWFGSSDLACLNNRSNSEPESISRHVYFSIYSHSCLHHILSFLEYIASSAGKENVASWSLYRTNKLKPRPGHFMIL